jgi:hypothetical protein
MVSNRYKSSFSMFRCPKMTWSFGRDSFSIRIGHLFTWSNRREEGPICQVHSYGIMNSRELLWEELNIKCIDIDKLKPQNLI